MSVLLSIITPVYNAGKFLRQAAESVGRQGVDDWEWLLVDDGSTDGSGRMCDELAQRDSRIKVFHLPNGGPGKAKDYALPLCSGRFVTFLDADDTWEPNTLELNLALFERYPDLEMVRFPIYAVEEDGRRIPFRNAGNTELLSGNRAIFSLWCRDLQKISGFMWGKIFRRELIAGVRVPDMRNSEDAYFMTEVLTRCKAMAFSNLGGYLYFQNRQSICHRRYSLEMLRNELKADGKILRTARSYAGFDDEFCHAYSLVSLKMLGWMRAGWGDGIKAEIPEVSRWFPSWKALWKCRLRLKSKIRIGIIKIIGWRGTLTLIKHLI